MSSAAARTQSREALLALLAQVGRANSDATVLFHSAMARSLGLNPTDYKALGVLDRLGAMSAGEIAERTGLASASVTELIDRLERKGFVRRASDSADRRRTMIEPVRARTDEARKQFASTQRSLARLYERYSNAELAIIADFLGANGERLRAETAKLAA